MSKRIGSIYEVEVDSDRVRHFWEVGTDQTQLGSALVVIFQQSYPKGSTPDFGEVTSDDVDFYCHANLLVGTKLGFWRKVGFRAVSRTFPMLFRDTDDIGNPAIRVSERWYVWEPNQPTRRIGRLSAEYQKAELGLVFGPPPLVNRIRTGDYGVCYPT